MRIPWFYLTKNPASQVESAGFPFARDVGFMEFASYILAPLTLFGGLLFWPLLRFWFKPGDPQIVWLKRVFGGQVLLFLITFGLVYYYWANENRDWLHSFMFPYAVGMLSIVASFIVLIVGLFFRNRIDGKNAPL